MQSLAKSVAGAILVAIAVAGCIVPMTIPEQTARGQLIVRIRNHRPTDVAMSYDGKSSASGSSMTGFGQACAESDSEMLFDDEWTFTVDGSRIVGSADRVDLRPGAGPPRTVTVTIEVDGSGARLAGVIPGRLPPPLEVLPGCATAPSSP
jgi:hypothetical protein